MKVPNAAELAAALRRCVTGLAAEEAAINLLAGHARWLRRADFLRFVDFSTEPNLTGSDEPLAVIHWDKLVRDIGSSALPGARSEITVLTVAASLAYGTPINLRDLVGLDEFNTELVLNAIAHATGKPHLASRDR
ncbi:hypothetical protein A8924_1523 [Saccharopolyspora erythraea NRRL 2338]|uniref:Uncharacterized protein n=2 Tax=Saccharopolyspora erythraea TaxID=1836 RepID=A4F8T2_SACEN|nr:hypothetical protein [Saccharopolyspora erythraea]EQD86789.1 hypothetical protein N599_07995 [Saccharopolyspora erythraea D]PFG94252.1 hypothetical protein A8924_1523 [Saccharopolyspora erythraea NRRL 2338]QRK91024.1 hypothetical protein JQX30_06160 [Saccharopolyspora erythraea]CAM00457.1 hypothetical protein SACE_1126 [Saccharopolyspora erythraea NRRL 2338]